MSRRRCIMADAVTAVAAEEQRRPARRARRDGMTESSPGRTFVAHALLLLGILIVAFPIYYTFVASSHTLQTILVPHLPLLPGDQFVENYWTALLGGVGRIGGVPVSTLLFNSTVVPLAIAIGK